MTRAQDAEERGQGICRTCLAPIWNEGGTIGRRKRAEGWSDRIERGGDSLVCFKAVEYRHVPLTGREAAIYDAGFARRSSTASMLHAAQDEIERRITECEGHRALLDAVLAEREAEKAWEALPAGVSDYSDATRQLGAAVRHRKDVVDSIGGA